MIFGQYIHPYIDNQIEDPVISQQVENLLDQEMKQMDPFSFPKPKIQPPIYIISDLSEVDNQKAEYIVNTLPKLHPKARLQELFQQESNLSFLLQRAPDFLENELFDAENKVKYLNQEKEQLQEKIDDIHRHRFVEQISEKTRLRNLQAKEKNLEDEIKEMEEKLKSLTIELEEHE